MSYPQEKLNVEWIRDGITPEVSAWAESFGEFLCAREESNGRYKVGRKALTTSQLRRFFGEVKRIESNVDHYKADIVMLKPAIAYAIGRDIENGRNKTRIKEFGEEMFSALDEVNRASDEEKAKVFRNFVKVLEAIVAYHKYYGGK